MTFREPATATDEIRQQVEAALLGAVRDTATGPCALVRRAWTTMTVPIGFTRTMLDLLVEGVLGRATTAPDPDMSATSDEPSPTTNARASGAPAAADAGVPTDLPIEDYESLAASQVIARLERMSPDELERIRMFELASRGRRTVIGKIDRLLAT